MYNIYIIIKKFKKISKRNLPNVGMAGWMDELADKSTQTRRAHSTTYSYISHNQPSSSGLIILPPSVSLLLMYIGMDV